MVLNQSRILSFSIFLIFLLFVYSCASVFEEQPKDFYTKNYGGFKNPPEDKISLVIEETNEDPPPEDQEKTIPEEVGLIADNPPEQTAEENDTKESTSPIEELAKPLEGNSLEEKLYLLTLNCYEVRDRFCFQEKRTLFLTSFPTSEYQEDIEKMYNNFYFYPEINRSYLQNGMLELEMPFFLNREEMRSYFKQLNEYGIKEVSWMPFQVELEKKILFAKDNYDFGAYFQSKTIPVIEDILGEMLSIAKSYGIKFYVRVPIRNHPWLQYYHSLLMSQSWDVIKKNEYYFPKLNVIHPYAKDYFIAIINELMTYPIDGILFDDDYTYVFEEGLSTLNRILYEDASNQTIRPIRIYEEEIAKYRKEEFATLYKPENVSFFQYTQWRMEQVQKFLIEVIDHIRFYNNQILIGIEATPSMILFPRVAFYWYTVQGNVITSLPVDLFILDWKKEEELKPAKEKQFLAALNFIERNKDPEQSVKIKALLDNKAKGVGEINKSIQYTLDLSETINEKGYVISSVNRIKNTDIVLNSY